MKRLLVMLVAAAALALVAAPAANAQEPTIVYTTPESGATAAEACRSSDNVVLIQLVVDGVAQRVSRPTAVVRGDRWGRCYGHAVGTVGEDEPGSGVAAMLTT